MPRPPRLLDISPEDRLQLQRWATSTKVESGLAKRARIVVLTTEGRHAAEVASSVGVSERSVYKWWWRFDKEGLEGLRERARSGRPRKLDLDQVLAILEKTIEETPPGATHWSQRLMAEATGVTCLYGPRRERGGALAGREDADPGPRSHAADAAAPTGTVRATDSRLQRHGTVSRYAAMDIATGKVIGKLTKRHRASEFLAFLDLVDRRTRAAETVRVILDNSGTHRTKKVRAWLEEHPRFQLHSTPTSAVVLDRTSQPLH